MGEVMFSSDAGEPSGSAGTPVLNAIRSSGLDYVMVVVVRYFGGILLGLKASSMPTTQWRGKPWNKLPKVLWCTSAAHYCNWTMRLTESCTRT